MLPALCTAAQCLEASLLMDTPLSFEDIASERSLLLRLPCRYKGREGRCRRINLLGGGTGITPIYQVHLAAGPCAAWLRATAGHRPL